MKPIREVYKDCGDDGWFSVYEYTPLLESLGCDICLQVDDDNYQGDSRVLFRSGNRWGILIFGWGSCSGCDALQACRNYDELEILRNSLVKDIHWEPDAEAALHYIDNHDWEGDFSWHSENTHEFVNKVRDLLKEELKQ